MKLLICIIYLLLEKVYCDISSLCNDGNECVSKSQCNPKNTTHLLYPCHSGRSLDLICCPKIEIVNTFTNSSVLVSKKGLFPKDCGLILIGDKITGGDDANLGEFPWMALLGYQQEGVDIVEHLCGGTVITESYILTAAHCLESTRHMLVSVRLGEHNLLTEKDCAIISDVPVCADDPIDVPVQRYVKHPKFNAKTLEHDIALVELKEPIKFTQYIKPICLPFGRNIENIDFVGQKLIITGWGKTDPGNVVGSPILQLASVRVWNYSQCNNVIPPEVRPVKETQLCANGKKEDACKGDSGGPLASIKLDVDEELRYFQEGIVSFAPMKTCGIEELPSIYTRLDKYLEWIAKTVK